MLQFTMDLWVTDMKYVTQEMINKYNGYFCKDKEIDLVHFANWFCESAVTTLSNKLFEHLEYDGYLIYNLYDWKKDCPVWEIRESETDGVIESVESLKEWVK